MDFREWGQIWTLDRIAIRLTQENNNNGTVSYSYNDAGLRTNMTVTDEDTVFYRYDNASRLTNVTQGTFTTSVFYDDSGRNQLTTTTGAALTKSYRFTAREDDGTGLYYYRARGYHPALGRFVSEDPLEFVDGPNFYAYVDNDPINWTDPSGLAVNQGCYWGCYAICILTGDATKVGAGFLTADLAAQGAFGNAARRMAQKQLKRIAGKLMLKGAERLIPYVGVGFIAFDATRCALECKEQCDECPPAK